MSDDTSQGTEKATCPASLEEVDLFAPGAQEHWYPAYEILHAEAPVLKLAGEGLTAGTDAYMLTRYADIARVVKDPDRFRPTITMAVEGIAPAVEQAYAEGREPDFPIQLTDMIVSMASLRPNKALYRAHKVELTDPWVGPGATRHKEMIACVADELIDRFIDRGEVEFVSEFARPLPQIVMANVLGFPREDLERLETWGNAMVRPFVHGRGHKSELPPEELGALGPDLQAFRDYVRDQIAEKRRNPGDDMTTFLTQVTYSPLDRKLHDLEICGVVYAMVFGGLETTQYALAEQAQLLCDDSDLLDEIRGDRSRVRPFTEEALRLRSPTQGLSTRITTQDEVFRGVAVPAGSLLHLRWAAGNVDPEEFACPHAIDLDRKGVGAHLAFSQGPRICPGANLSRIEQQVAWNRWLDRISGMKRAAEEPAEHQPGIMLGTLALPLRFERAH